MSVGLNILIRHSFMDLWFWITALVPWPQLLIENKINGFILRSKANVIEHNERNSKYFSSLEKKKSESKLISRLTINNQTTTDQTEVLKATEDFYKNLYKTKESQTSAYNFFDDTMKKLNEIEKESCDGL